MSAAQAVGAALGLLHAGDFHEAGAVARAARDRPPVPAHLALARLPPLLVGLRGPRLGVGGLGVGGLGVGRLGGRLGFVGHGLGPPGVYTLLASLSRDG